MMTVLELQALLEDAEPTDEVWFREIYSEPEEGGYKITAMAFGVGRIELTSMDLN